jgi:5-formyltetrahydrofolate cyclo-ligase
MDKTELRQEAERVRANLTLTGDEPQQAAALFRATFQVQPGHIVALYWPVRRELDPIPLIEGLHADGITTALPVIQAGADRGLDFVPYDGRGPLTPGPHGIPQPTGPSVVPHIVVVPLLAFDRRGYRLGYGGGYYDRTLAKWRADGHNILTVGYAYAEQMCLFPLPIEEHDMRLDFVITPQQVHDFRG